MSKRGRKNSKKESNRTTSNEAKVLIKLLEKAKECSKCRRKN
jgi:hypothetical protein